MRAGKRAPQHILIVVKNQVAVYQEDLMDEIILWDISEFEKLLQSEAEDGSIVSVTLIVDTGEERDADG